jgi:hypothetical protein
MVPSIGKYYLDFPRKNRSRSFEVKSWDFLREIQVINFLCAFIIYSFTCGPNFLREIQVITLSIFYLFIL